MTTGIHRGMPMEDYLALDAMGSTRLGWLAVSPLYYRWMMDHPKPGTDATDLGTMLHAAVLEPDTFSSRYGVEPNIELIGGAKPRATNAYKDEVAAMEAGGCKVMRTDAWRKLNAMARSVLAHPVAVKLLRRAPEREVTMIWDRGRACRGRADLFGDGIQADLKTTRNLRGFSPFVITRMGYYRQAGWYKDGAARLGASVEHCYYIAVENVEPYDVGVFTLPSDAIDAGRLECDVLLERLEECEASGVWPGQFPDLMTATITDDVALPEAIEEE